MAICERLGIGSIVAVEPLHAPQNLLRLRDPGPQSALIRLFLLQQAAPEAELQPAFRACDAELLVELGLVERQSERLVPQADLYPYGEDWLATDRSDRAGEGRAGRFDAVMPLNMSSHTLAQLVLPSPVGVVLDVGTGCGVHAIRAARRARHVIATDLNPRALRFAAFNAALNGVGNIELREGDLWEPVRGERFDQIVANPAFSLAAETEFLFRDGGARGDRMTGALLAGAVEHLRDGGVAQVIGEFPTIGESGFEEQVEGWVGDTPCDRLLLRFGAMEPLEYAVAYAHQPFSQSREEYEAALGARLRQFEALGVRDVVLGAVLLRRTREPRWAARRVLPAPERSMGRELIELARRLDRWESEEAPDWLWEGRPAMVPGLRLTETRVWKEEDWEEETTHVSVAGDPFCHDLQLSGPARELLALCDGTRRGSEIAAEFARLYQLAVEEAREAAVAFMKELAVQGLVTVDADGALPRSGGPGPGIEK
jgi:methylase of polypeptide subunit release factors